MLISLFSSRSLVKKKQSKPNKVEGKKLENEHKCLENEEIVGSVSQIVRCEKSWVQQVMLRSLVQGQNQCGESEPLWEWG